METSARADAACERRGDARVFKIELGIADLRLGIIDRGLRGVQFGRALFHRLGRREAAALERLGASQFAGGERKPRRRGLQQSVCSREPDLIGPRVDDKQEVAFVDDLAILEMDLGQCAADLSAQLDAIDCGELTEHADARVDVAHERLAHRDARRRHPWRACGSAGAVGEAEPDEDRKPDQRRGDYPRPYFSVAGHGGFA